MAARECKRQVGFSATLKLHQFWNYEQSPSHSQSDQPPLILIQIWHVLEELLLGFLYGIKSPLKPLDSNIEYNMIKICQNRKDAVRPYASTFMALCRAQNIFFHFCMQKVRMLITLWEHVRFRLKSNTLVATHNLLICKDWLAHSFHCYWSISAGTY